MTGAGGARRPETPEISVVVCTRNRAEPLRGLLASFETLKAPRDTVWELLIVDNGSSDHTREVVESFEGRLPIRYTREDTPGLSNARNHGVSAARGRMICWTDDDVEIHEDWLSAYAEAFLAHPEAQVFGGAIHPKLLPPTPSWFARLLGRWPISDIVAARDFGPVERPLSFEGNYVPWGANFAVARQAQIDHPYDPNLGVSPNQRRSGEETQAMFEIMGAGATGWWVPGSRVFHLYPPHRQSRRYFHDHYFAIGETRAYLDDTHERHYMNRDGRQPRLYRRRARLVALRAFYGLLFCGFHVIGMTLRSLYYLYRYASYSGAAAYRPPSPRASDHSPGAASRARSFQ